MAQTDDDGETPSDAKLARVHTDKPTRNYKLIYQRYKQNPRVYEHIKQKNAEWMREHPEVNRRNQKLTQERRRKRKVEERQQRFPGWITTAEATKLLGHTRQRTHQLIQAGELGETTRYGKRILVRRTAVEAYIESRTPIK